MRRGSGRDRRPCVSLAARRELLSGGAGSGSSGIIMARRREVWLIAAGCVALCLCVGGLAVVLRVRFASKPPAIAAPMKAAPPPAADAGPTAPLSTIIDLPGDPVLVSRTDLAGPRPFHASLPATVASGAPRLDMMVTLVSTPLDSSSGFIGKFPEGGQEAPEANILTADPQAIADAGSDDDGGDETPPNAVDATALAANSNQLDVFPGGANGKPQLKQAVMRAIVPEKIADILIRNGFSEESARAVEDAAKASTFGVQSLPAGALAIAVGALDLSGAYRVAQLSIYEGAEYVGTIALAEAGGYGEGAEPTRPRAAIDDSNQPPVVAQRFNLADGIYSAGVRENVPEPVIREAIGLIARLTDLKAPIQAGQTLRLLYTREPRGKAKGGNVVYVGVSGAGAAVDCYAFATSAGAFACYDPKAAASPATGPKPPPKPSPRAPAATAEAEVAPEGGGMIIAPIKGAPVTSLFGMRFHPILHITRLHAGIDFGAPVGSTVRAAADGVVEFAGERAGFGNHIRIQHKGFETSYSHLSQIPDGIAAGAAVKVGQMIALSGNTGLSTGPHLHFEYYLGGAATDPMPHLGGETATAIANASISSGSITVSAGATEDNAGFLVARGLVDKALEEGARL
jgi:murein DD-endopeptidase MepM/ murein hydrolase activator NlpD